MTGGGPADPAPPRLTAAGIAAAAPAIAPVFRHTPPFVCEPPGAELGVRLGLKVETVNPVRSFKGRGADLLVGRADPAVPLVCASAGNFGQGMAYARRGRGVRLTVYAAAGANPLKVERMRAFGAEVVLHGDDFDAAKAEARRAAAAAGARFVEDGRDAETAEGAGTIGLEWAAGDLPDVLLIPLGNGALAAGVGVAVKAARPGTRVVAVGAAGAPAMVESLRAGRPVAGGVVRTVADGIAVREPVPEALADLRGVVDDALLVSEAAILRALRLAHRHAGLVVEPAGAVGLAALVEFPGAFRGGFVGTVLSPSCAAAT